MSADRKDSPLAANMGDRPSWVSQPPEPEPPTPAPDEAEAPPPVMRRRVDNVERVQGTGKRKRRSGGNLDPFALVSFNCKMTVVNRRLVRMFAAQQDSDIQDVVAEALIEYLQARNIAVPRTVEQYEAMVAAGKL